MSGVESEKIFGDRLQARVADWVARPLFWLCLVISIASYPIFHGLTHELPEPLPSLSKVGDFQLIDEFGETYDSKELEGRMWAVASVCTACSDKVDEMGKRLFRLQHRSRAAGKSFRLLTITRDPERDTPNALETWARGLRYSPRMWKPLTGSKADLDALHRDIFQTPAVRSGAPGTLPGLDTRFQVALVGMSGQVRGYFDIRSEEGLQELLNIMRVLINRGY